MANAWIVDGAPVKVGDLVGAEFIQSLLDVVAIETIQALGSQIPVLLREPGAVLFVEFCRRVGVGIGLTALVRIDRLVRSGIRIDRLVGLP